MEFNSLKVSLAACRAAFAIDRTCVETHCNQCHVDESSETRW